ncbi:hypothetical protein LCGC14_2048420 [marine sediment metagenome]|uniref:Uncharacterized protein n=1 Tax=marine sediment metagenome TaxID=412755 RepID=A0A0F9EPN8_9ZZZZ
MGTPNTKGKMIKGAILARIYTQGLLYEIKTPFTLISSFFQFQE